MDADYSSLLYSYFTAVLKERPHLLDRTHPGPEVQTVAVESPVGVTVRISNPEPGALALG